MSQPGSPATDALTSPTPATTAAAAPEPLKPTEKEAYLFYNILTSLTNEPKIDWDLVATKSGYSNGVSARARYGQIRKRLGLTDNNLNSNEGASASGTPTETPNKAPKPRAKKENADNGSGYLSSGLTPTKVKKPRPSRSKKALADAEAKKTEAMLKNEDQFYGGLYGVAIAPGTAQLGFSGDFGAAQTGVLGFKDEFSDAQTGVQGVQDFMNDVSGVAYDGVQGIPGFQTEFSAAQAGVAGAQTEFATTVTPDQVNYGPYGYQNPMVTHPVMQQGYQIGGEIVGAAEYHRRMQAFYAKHPNDA